MKIRDEYEYVDMGFASLLVPVGDEAIRRKRVIVMNDESSCLIKALQEERSVNELAVIMMQEYDVDLNTVKRDIHEHLKKLEEMELLAG